ALARLTGAEPGPGPGTGGAPGPVLGPGPGLEVSADPVVMTPGGPMVMTEFLRTRAVEAVVHGLDLGVEPERPALRLAARLVAELFAARVPGHAVELRIPPFAAVQVGAGPRHTRGTPPNVVESGPVPFLLLCTGRLSWDEAIADGRITASGERADLSEHLPLL
ncbi:sterol carrier family protein, partial [Frankia sp. AgKG'84/4]|uniref:sterol carrier family protein n=1 Tax=Frankia sp. AgKG'84/4 TaxID=573490 RepID=UPI002029D0D1